VESGFPKSMPSRSTRGIMLKQKARLEQDTDPTITHPALAFRSKNEQGSRDEALRQRYDLFSAYTIFF
jgi:hypothetical protein